VKEGWQTKTLGDLFDITSSKRVFEADWKTEGVPFYRAREIVKLARHGFVENELFISEEMFDRYSTKYGIPAVGDIMVTGVGTLGICYVVKKDDRFYFKDGNIIWLKKKTEADSCFVEYAFQSDYLRSQIDNSVGATVGTYTIIKAKSTLIPVPPLSEQKRIVGILDEAFEGIATAKANAEKNLQNARALFESHLQSVFTQRGKGWVEKTIGQCFKVRSGDFLPAKVMIETGDIDVYGGNGIAGKHNAKNLSGENIVIGRVGAKCGNVRHVVGDLWLTDNAFYISEFYCEFDLAFMERLLTLKNLRNNARQAAQPVISYTTIKDVVLEFPVSKAVQKEIAGMFDALEIETQRLESIYQQKLTALEALKKSLLNQAFTGEL